MGVTAEALAKAVNVMDSSRRVGWAKAYSAAEQADAAARDANIARGDRDAFQRGLSYLYGLVIELSNGALNGLLAHAIKEVAGADSLMDEAAVKQGRRRGVSLRAADDAYAEERSLKEAAKRRNANASKRQWETASRRGVENLAARYGFRSIAELEAVLGSWQERSGRPPIKRQELTDFASRRYS